MKIKRTIGHIWFCGVIFLSLHAGAQDTAREQKDKAEKPPVIPVGLDAYRMWDQWPVQRIGARAYMRSTYDRSGGNREADSRNFIYMGEEEDFNVTLDVQGKGVLYFVRTNHWHGSPWHYVVDGRDHLVKETGTADPVHAKERFATTTFIPAKPFPEPLAFTWGTTRGANLMWVPIGFEESFQLAYSRTFYGTGYYIYKQYANENYLSQPIRAWDISDVPDPDVLKLIERAGSDIAPQHISKESGNLRLDQEKVLVSGITSAPSVIRALKFTLPLEKAIGLGHVRLLVTWDGANHPSVNAPLSLFFGAGTLYNRKKTEFLVKGFPVNIRFNYPDSTVELACYYPMPFFKSAKVELAGIRPGDTEIGYEIRYEAYDIPPSQSSYFHATYRNFPDPEPGVDLTLLDTRGVEGHREWSGSFVGTSFIFSQDAFLGTLEGDPRFFFDGSKSPQAHGTGTEEWGGGGDYWGGRNMTLPFAGHPVGAPNRKEARNKEDLIQSAYRFLLADLMPFGNRAVIRLDHGGWNLSKEHYETVTYWYGLPAPSLVKTDVIDIGKEASETYHAYESPDASAVQEVISRYDGLGIDTFPADSWGMKEGQRAGYEKLIGSEVFPAHSEDGRYTRGTSAFTVALVPDNWGALLRRTLDYSFPNQKARVYVADASNNRVPESPQWEYAGIWYLAGSNTYVYSPADGELGKRKYHVKTSNRRFRDDEFLIPAALTRGHSAIRVRIEFFPVTRELYPEHPYPKESAWSELGYEVYSYVMPDFSIRE